MEKEIFKYLGKAIFAFGTIFIGVLIFMFTPYFSSLQFSNAGPFGDILSGLSAAFIGSLGVSFTFLAFWVQFQANLEQRRDIKIERFENRFYEMLRLHNETARDIDVAGRHSGRKAFVYLFDEFRFGYQIVERELKEWNSQSELDQQIPLLKYNEERIAEFAYKMFFFGVGKQSDKATLHVHGIHTPFYIKIRTILKGLQAEYRKQSNNGKYIRLKYGTFNAIDLEINYVPFDGHVSKLGHYYRHIYQTVKFIDEQGQLDDKYSFMKTFRAQLSNHEQLLLYYNSFFIDLWWKEGLFLRSRIVKNIPLYLSDFGPHPVDRFRSAVKNEKPNITDEEIKVELGKLLEWY